MASAPPLPSASRSTIALLDLFFKENFPPSSVNSGKCLTVAINLDIPLTYVDIVASTSDSYDLTNLVPPFLSGILIYSGRVTPLFLRNLGFALVGPYLNIFIISAATASSTDSKAFDFLIFLKSSLVKSLTAFLISFCILEWFSFKYSATSLVGLLTK